MRGLVLVSQPVHQRNAVELLMRRPRLWKDEFSISPDPETHHRDQQGMDAQRFLFCTTVCRLCTSALVHTNDSCNEQINISQGKDRQGVNSAAVQAELLARRLRPRPFHSSYEFPIWIVIFNLDRNWSTGATLGRREHCPGQLLLPPLAKGFPEWTKLFGLNKTFI